MAREFEKKLIERVLTTAGWKVVSGLHPPMRSLVSRLMADRTAHDAVRSVYSALGGRAPIQMWSPGRWDIETENVIVEFDEEQHFNRYRAMTLQCPLYSRFRVFPLRAYRDFCRDREADCTRKAGTVGYWTKPGAQAHFGPPDPPKVFGICGSPRWKQRAFYDMLRDFAPLVLPDLAVVRIALWDELRICGRTQTIREALQALNDQVAEALVSLIRVRSGDHRGPGIL